MFNLHRAPKKFEGTKEQMRLRQGFNAVNGLFFILVTDKKSGITCRINMDDEYFENFHDNGRFTYRQTKKDEGEFED